MCFTLPNTNRVLAIVYTDQSGNGRLIGRTTNNLDPSPLIPEKELDAVPDLVIPVRIGVPSQEPTFGILLISEKSVTFLNTGLEHDAGEPQESTSKGKSKGKTRSKSEVKAAIQASMVTVAVPFRDVTAWTQVDETHILVGDSSGQLYLLTMAVEPEFTLRTTLLGQVSVPSTISYLSNNIVYIGSYSAPSQLVRIFEDISIQPIPEAQGKKKHVIDDTGDGGHLEIMVTHNENIAPILDAMLIDVDGSAQARIAAVSGDDSGGALHIIYRGASFRESAVLDGLPNLENLFVLKKHYNAQEHAYLAATTNTGTFLFSLSPTQLTVMTAGDLPSISRTSRTLLLTNLDLPGLDAVIHVTSNHASVIDLVTGRGISSWNPPRGDITAAAVDTAANVVCIATSPGGLFCLGVQPGGMVKTNERNFSSKPHPQISALAVDKNTLVATFWGSNETVFLNLADLQHSKAITSTEPSAASSVLLSNFGETQMYSIIARLDGALVVQAIPAAGAPLPNARRVIPLGGGPINLTSVAAHGNTGAQVIAAGKQAVVLSIVNKRLNVSSLSVTGICAISALNTAEMGSSIVYASSTGLVFGQVEQLDKLNITSHSLGNDSPLRLAYHPQLSTFVVGCMRVMTQTDSERYFLRFFDDSTFGDLGQAKLQYQEVVASVAPYTSAGDSYILVGTGTIHTGQNEAHAGRIMVFKADAETRLLQLQYGKEVEGQVSSIKQFKQRIIAAINDRVCVFDLENDEGALSIGDPVAKWDRAYSVESLAIRGETIVVADKLRSVSVLRLVETFTDAPSNAGEDDMDVVEQRTVSVQLQTVAMDMGAVWPCAIELDGNILTWEIGDGKLEPGAAFYVGEIINKFVILPPRSSSNIRPVALYVTNSGRIGMLSTVDDEDAVQLTRLELKLDKTIKGLGGMSHSAWRAPKLLSSSKKPPPRRGVTDGDFIKKFVELDDESARKILSEGSAAERIGPAEEEQIRRCLEALSVDQ